MTSEHPAKTRALSHAPWWDKKAYHLRRPKLLARARMIEATRTFFKAQDFIEVDTAILQVSPGNETHIGAFATAWRPLGGNSAPLYLHTSPEFAAKKLLAAGEERIFTFTHAFRNDERDRLHHPEFMMLEWYRAEAPFEVLMFDCARLLALTAQAAEAKILSYRGRVADPFTEPEQLTVCEAFQRYAGIDLEAFLPGGPETFEAFAAKTRELGLRVAPDDDWSDLFSKILSDRIEPKLGQGRATFLTDYPACEAALARLRADSRFAERFELYACGVELANGFGELTDPVEQERRFEAAMAERLRIYGEAYPIDPDFLAALAQMPEASGIAFGFDRLAMLATGSDDIAEVLWTPVAESPGEGA
ncbi:EF-P lysine aminoacylase EpmA [Beijerinckia indica]|uniref:Lysine--tRNA ligase n=1 Tax=Beijerinckia indica subsp. indica (strain ATCC 9039 / DSM 1715 / NCIMB 8712) TaxID=395963 RepID=B2ID19_BEII9|nr:EF-P lysine aminoacylase EpmA [Beijerinckia indica]ACB96784.1 Lysine--tRNA ligase [Beijerinckia indica subsp. indica ATCC 9039]